MAAWGTVEPQWQGVTQVAGWLQAGVKGVPSAEAEWGLIGWLWGDITGCVGTKALGEAGGGGMIQMSALFNMSAPLPLPQLDLSRTPTGPQVALDSPLSE